MIKIKKRKKTKRNCKLKIYFYYCVRYIRQLSTYTDLQTHIPVQFPLSGLWHFTMFCKEKLYFIQRPRLWKILFTFEIFPLFSLLYSFSLKKSDFSTVIPFTDEIKKSWTLGLRLVLRIRASDCQQKCSENDPIQRLHTMLQLSALILSRNWLESPLFCFQCWVAPLYFYFPLGSVSSTTPKK